VLPRMPIARMVAVALAAMTLVWWTNVRCRSRKSVNYL
jgi:hypothetical protein